MRSSLIGLLICVLSLHGLATESHDNQQRRLRGDLIGNGAGLAEQSFRLAYSQIPQLIDECLGSASCLISNEEERELLNHIALIVELNRSRSDALVFLSSQEHPEFFYDSVVDPQIRVAKAEPPTISGSIYIDLEQIYNDRGEVVFGTAEMVTLLVHEIGHQAGEPSHSLLDVLGAKVALFATSDSHDIEVTYGQRAWRVEAINFDNPHTFSLLNVYVDDSAYALTDLLKRDLACNEPDARPVGLHFSNLHWSDSVINGRHEVRGLDRVLVRAWTTLTCETEQGDIVTESDPYFASIKVDEDGDVSFAGVVTRQRIDTSLTGSLPDGL